MNDGSGKELTQEELLKAGLDHVSDACCFFFELESPEGEAIAFMADALLKYGTVIRNGDSPISASCDYQAYEEKKYQEFLKKKEKEKKLKVIK